MTLSPALLEDALRWRREFHRHPELGYQEQQTSQFIAEELARAGLQVFRGLAGTGVIGTGMVLVTPVALLSVMLTSVPLVYVWVVPPPPPVV